MFFPFLFFFGFFLLQKGGRRALRIQWRLSISDEPFVAARGWAFILFDRRAGVLRLVLGIIREGNAYHGRLIGGSNSSRIFEE